MRAAPPLALLLVLTAALPTPALAEETPTLRIGELLPAPDAARGQREFIELHNAGTAAVDLQGWVLRDAPTASNNTNAFTFPAFTLDPNRRVVVWSNGTPDGSGFAWSQSASKTVWNDAGDTATLLDTQGNVQAWFGYGSTTHLPPPGFEADKPAAPAKGSALQWSDNAWTAAAPTPGWAPGESGGTVTAVVANLAPTARLATPPTVRPGQAVAVRITVDDPNGPNDVAAWSLHDEGAALQSGNASLDATRVVTAPLALGNWTLRLTARDAAGAQATAVATLQVQRPSVSVHMPDGGAVRFLDLHPGQRNATTTQPFTLRNDGPVVALPLLDISPLRSGRHVIPVDGNLWLGLDHGLGDEWVAYTGPLQALPELAPSAELRVLLRIAQVPDPAAAGVYGTSFTVVPA